MFVSGLYFLGVILLQFSPKWKWLQAQRKTLRVIFFTINGGKYS